MFESILGSSKSESSEDKGHQMIVARVAKMNLTDMKTYVNNKLDDFGICEDGLTEVMKMLNSTNAQTSKRFIESDAMDSKKKKAFDLVISIAENKKTTVAVLELVQEFIKMYKDIITQYDTDNKQIYFDKFKNALKKSLNTIATIIEMDKKSRILS